MLYSLILYEEKRIQKKIAKDNNIIEIKQRFCFHIEA